MNSVMIVPMQSAIGAAKQPDGTDLRESLTFLAILLILVLAAAFAGPHFVDWTAQKPLIEAQLGEALGHAARLEGPVDIRLLPSPRLQLGRVTLPGLAGEPEFSAEAVTVELATMPLLRGELRFVEAQFSHPVLHAGVAADGRLVLPQFSRGLGRDTRFEWLTLSDATLVIDNKVTGRVLTLNGLDLQAEAASLDGPFKGTGQIAGDAPLVAGAAPLAFRFSTSTLEQGKLRFKVAVDESAGWPRAELDGTLLLPNGSDPAAPARFDGSASFSGHVALGDGARAPWKLSGQFQADARSAISPALDLRLGNEETAFVVAGDGEIRFGAQPEASVTLAARQIDLDRLGAGGAATAAPLIATLRDFIADPNAAARLPFALNAALSSPIVTLGGQTLTDVSGAMDIRPGQPMGLKLSGSGPGRSALALDGALEPGAAAGFKGTVEVATKDAGRLADWLAPLAPEAAAWLRAAPFRAMDMAGHAEMSGVGFSGRDLRIQLDRSALTGAMAYTSAIWTERARLFADLSSSALDLDAAPDLTAALRATGGMDLSLTLDAHSVKLARFGEGMIDAGRIGARLVKTGDDIHLERLVIDNLGGASIAATGIWHGSAEGSARGRLDAKVDAARLGDASDLLRRIAPGAATEALAARAAALSPAKLTLAVEAGLASPRGAITMTALTLEGTAGATQVNAAMGPESASAKTIAATLLLEAPEAGALLRQIGFDARLLSGQGTGRIKASLRGSIDAPLAANVDASLAGTHLVVDGKLAGLANLAEPLLRGSFRLDSANLMPLTQVLALASPDAAVVLPASLAGEVEAGAASLAVAHLAGKLGGSMIEGDLALQRGGVRGHLQGSVRLDKLDFPVLTGLALGRAQPLPPGATWPDAKFGSGLADAPDTQLALKIASFTLSPALAARNATLTLGLAPGTVTLEGMAMQIGEGHASGDVSLRRDGANASVAANIAFEGLAIGLPSLAGSATGRLDLTATGTSAGTLVGALAGVGQVALTQVQVPRASAGTIAAVLGLADTGKLALEEGAMQRVLARELDRGAFAVERQAFDITAAAGTLRLNPVDDGPMKLILDLRSMVLDQRITQTLAQNPKDWTGPLPRIDVAFKGPLSGPLREIDAGNFINGLSAREIARDTARIAALDADIRERAAFNRRLKADRQSRQNEIDLQRFIDAEAKRLADEEARRKAEDARRAAEEAKAKALEAAKAEREKRAADEARRKADEIARKSGLEPRAPPVETAPVNILPPVKPPDAAVAPALPPVDPSALGPF